MIQGRKLLEQGLSQLNIQFTDKQIEQFMKYYDLLIEKNKVMNLTAITDLNEVMTKHFLDSVLISNVLDMSDFYTLVDVGTGAGFPGIPIKILFPHLKVTLIDSLNKRLKFLDDVISELELDGIETVHGRAEDLGNNDLYREKYDLCVSRAVANLSTLSEYCIPFIAKNGKFISYKSSISSEEIQNAKSAIKMLGGTVVEEKTVHLPCSDMDRTFVVVNKTNNTGKKYPRKAGTPSKEPL